MEIDLIYKRINMLDTHTVMGLPTVGQGVALNGLTEGDNNLPIPS